MAVDCAPGGLRTSPLVARRDPLGVGRKPGDEPVSLSRDAESWCLGRLPDGLESGKGPRGSRSSRSCLVRASGRVSLCGLVRRGPIGVVGAGFLGQCLLPSAAVTQGGPPGPS
jgi:hypothetical protein